MKPPRTWIATIFLACIVARAAADDRTERTERVIAAGRLWAELAYSHPYLAYQPIDWDAAFVSALPSIEAAATPAAYRRAIDGMLAPLHDPVTRVLEPVPPTAVPPTGPWLTLPGPEIVMVDMAGFIAGGFDFVGWQTKGRQVIDAVAKAKVLVIDGRTAEPALATTAIENFVRAFPAIERWPQQRVVEHHGYRTQDGASSGGYYSTFVAIGARPATPAGSGLVHVVFLADTTTEIPAGVLALQAQGRATIVSTSPILEEAVALTRNLELPGGLTVQLRIGELLEGRPVADVRVPVAELRARALTIARGKLAARPVAARRTLVALPPLQPRDDADYAATPLPSRELRVLAGIRLWAVLDRFFPYRALIPDWDRALRDALPRLEAAATAGAYLTALQELGARARDGHIGIYRANPTTSQGLPGIETRLIEGQLAVLRLVVPADAGGLVVGDVIESIDGKPAAAVLAEGRATTSGSTDEARDQRVAASALVGRDGSSVKLGVRGRDGRRRDVVLARRAANLAAYLAPAAGPVWKKLTPEVGYVDLTRLTVPEVDAAFRELATTRALVFDLRGYPQGTAWTIAPRINTRRATHAAQFLQPYLTAGSGDARIQFLQTIAALPPNVPLYRGAIVVLIDDRAISQAEHSCLFFQEAAGATFIGSPTHGANGDVTRGRLPGGLRFTFTGQEVRHAGGAQLQRIGIQPRIVIRPTLAGIRDGKDEVLARALAFLATGR